MKTIISINLLFILLFLSSCDPFHTITEKSDTTIVRYEAKDLKPIIQMDSILKIVTWNIKFGGGRIDFFFDCHGDRVLMTESEVKSNMDGIVANIKTMNPDVIFLQEADIDSKRSAYVDQIQYILDRTDLNYAVYAAQWEADYVPSDGIGQMNSGNAILSKYPLDNAERIALPLIGEQSGLVQYFYLRRNLLMAEITVDNKKINLLGTHTSAYSTDGTKKKQLDIILKKITDINAKGETFILGGDFNNLPLYTQNYCDFDDNACKGGDFEVQSCDVLAEELNNMEDYYVFEPAITHARYQSNEDLYYSFTSDKDGFWNRKLDYIFTNGDFVDMSGMVRQSISSGGVETMPLSDHAPVSVLYKLN